MNWYSISLKGQIGDNLRSLPADYHIHGSRFVAWSLILFAVVFGLESIFVTINALIRHELFTLNALDMIWAAFGVTFFVIGLNQFFIRGNLVISNTTVSCEYQSIFGKRKWQEPLNRYKGLARKKEVNRASGAFSQIMYTIWLTHDRRSRSLKIYRAWSDEGLEEELLRYQAMFRLSEIKV
jgi:hypothetical protein